MRGRGSRVEYFVGCRLGCRGRIRDRIFDRRRGRFGRDVLGQGQYGRETGEWSRHLAFPTLVDVVAGDVFLLLLDFSCEISPELGRVL